MEQGKTDKSMIRLWQLIEDIGNIINQKIKREKVE